MRLGPTLRHLVFVTGAVTIGVTTLPAQDWRDTDRDRRDLRSDYRDLRGDYARLDRMQADIARERARLNEDIRCGRQGAAARDVADLARDQRAMNAQMR